MMHLYRLKTTFVWLLHLTVLILVVMDDALVHDEDNQLNSLSANKS